MAKLNTKVLLVDNKWSVVVTDNKETFLRYSSAGLHEARRIEQALRTDIHRWALTIVDFRDCPPVYKRLSNRKKQVYTTQEPLNDNS